MNISGLNGTIKADIGLASSYYSKNALGKFTDKNMLDTILKDRPQEYDRIIKLFTQGRLYSNDFTDLVMQNGKPFYIEEPDTQFTYQIHKYTDLPKIIINLADTTIKPGIDGSEFDLVFDKKVWVKGDIITAHRREQEVQLQVASDAVEYQNFFKYSFRAIGKSSTDFVHQRFIQAGTEYMKIGNRIGEYSKELSSIGLIDGKLTVVHEGLMEYGIEHTMTEYARLKQIQTDRFGKKLDLTYYSVTGQNTDGTPINLTAWEPTVASLMRAETDFMEKWSQNCSFTMNTIRYTLDNLFNQRVAIKDRKAKIYTNRAGYQLINKAIREDALGMGFTFLAQDYVKGSTPLTLGFSFGFDHYTSKETGLVEFVELEQLNEANTFLEQGPNKRVTPLFIILDISGGTDLGLRELKLKSRPNMMSAYIPGVTGFNGTEGVMAASKDPYQTWLMKDFTGIFLEDPTRTVLIKEYPQI